MQKAPEERVKLIVKLRADGKTLQEIAGMLKITRQRVHQILKETSRN